MTDEPLLDTLGRLYMELRAELDRLAELRDSPPRWLCLHCGRTALSASTIDHADDCGCAPVRVTDENRMMIKLRNHGG